MSNNNKNKRESIKGKAKGNPKKAMALINTEFRPYDLWAAGNCPVCGAYHSGDFNALDNIICRCGQLLYYDF